MSREYRHEKCNENGPHPKPHSNINKYSDLACKTGSCGLKHRHDRVRYNVTTIPSRKYRHENCNENGPHAKRKSNTNKYSDLVCKTESCGLKHRQDSVRYNVTRIPARKYRHEKCNENGPPPKPNSNMNKYSNLDFVTASV